MTKIKMPSLRNYNMHGYCMGSGTTGPIIVQGTDVRFESFLSQGPDEKESELFEPVGGDPFNYKEILLKAGFWYEIEGIVGLFSPTGVQASLTIQWITEDGKLLGQEGGISTLVEANTTITETGFEIAPAWAFLPAHKDTKISLRYKRVSTTSNLTADGTRNFKIKTHWPL